MPVQINEVIIRAIITGSDNNQQPGNDSNASDKISTVSKTEMLELIDEVIHDKKER